jgi:hypothetical protein
MGRPERRDKKIQIILEEMEMRPDHPFPGVQDNGQVNRIGNIPMDQYRKDIVSGKSGGHKEPNSDLGV